MSNKETIETRPVVEQNYYVSNNAMHSLFGLIFSFSTMAIGMFTISILITFGVRFEKTDVITALSIFYGFGLITIITSILVYHLIILVSRFISYLFPKKDTETDEEAREKRLKKSKELEEKRLRREANPSIFVLAWRWIVAYKEKNCPIIYWDYDRYKKK